MTESPLVNSCFAVLIFSPGDDPIACLNKAMDFLIAVASLRRQGQSYSSTGYKSNATSSEGNNASGKTKNAKAVLIANISNYGYDVISEVVQIVLLSEDFGKRFTPQQKLSAEQAFWFSPRNHRVLPIESSNIPPVKVEVPSELPKSSVDKQCLEIAKKELLLENNRLLQQIMSQYVLLTMMNYMSLNGESVNMERKRNESCDKNVQAKYENFRSRVIARNRNSRRKYLKYTQEQADILRGIVKQAKAKQPLDNALDFTSIQLICATCKKSMFDGVHDMCLLDFVENVNSRAKSAKKHKKQNIWKPTGHVFTEVGLKWKPTGRTFTIVVYKKAKIVESKNANHSKPNHTWGSNATDIPSSSSLVMIGCPNYSLVSGLQMFETYDREPLSAMNFVSKFLACALGKSKKSFHQPKAEDTNQDKLYLLHMDLYGPMRVAYINGKSSGLGLHSMTHVTSSSGLVPNPVSQQPCIPPQRDDWDRLFQLMFDEYFTPSSIAISPVLNPYSI
ncbi:hypothetical protein Tco_0915702 [Tanacetum coccineum]